MSHKRRWRPWLGRIEACTRQPSLPTLGKLLAAVDLYMRIQLESYDDHENVLEAAYAAMTPEQRAGTGARHEAMIALVDGVRQAQS